MVSLRVLRVVAAALAWAAALAHVPNAAAQDTFEPVARNEAQRALVERIAAAQAAAGPFAPEIADLLTRLAILYDDGGDTELAAAANERALQIVRVNKGLFAIEQLPLLREALANEDVDGDGFAAGRLARDLDLVMGRHPNDLRLVPAYRDLGDRQMVQLRRLLAGELPKVFHVGGSLFSGWSYDGTVSNGPPTRSDRARAMSLAAFGHYAKAVEVLLNNRAYDAPELGELEMTLVNLAYRQGLGFYVGRRSLIRQVSYAIENDEPMLTQLDLLLRVADWDLLFTNHISALETYEQAYTLLRQRDVPAGAIDRIFAPEIPIMLPTFEPNPLVTDEAGSTGYIDVAFDLHRYGDARNVRIVGASASATPADGKELIHVIRTAEFRPRVSADAFARFTPVKFRYYLHGEAGVETVY